MLTNNQKNLVTLWQEMGIWCPIFPELYDPVPTMNTRFARHLANFYFYHNVRYKFIGIFFSVDNNVGIPALKAFSAIA